MSICQSWNIWHARSQNLLHQSAYLKDFLSECHLAHTARFFIRVIVLDNDRRGPVVGLRHSDFLSHWSQRTRTDFLSPNCREERSDFLSNKKSAHMNRFSLRFFVYDKNRSVFAGHNTDINGELSSSCRNFFVNLEKYELWNFNSFTIHFFLPLFLDFTYQIDQTCLVMFSVTIDRVCDDLFHLL